MCTRSIGAAVDWIRNRRAVDRVDLVGWSWGTTTTAMYTVANNQKINRLVLYAPQWLRQGTTPIAEKLPAYRTVTREQAYQRWITGLAPEVVESTIPRAWFDRWADATFATDPEGAKQTPAVLRAPNGVMQDSRQLWFNRPHWNPADLRVPTLVIVGEWDRDTPPVQAQTLFPLITNAPTKRLVHLGRATHTVVLERERAALFRAVPSFLEE